MAFELKMDVITDGYTTKGINKTKKRAAPLSVS